MGEGPTGVIEMALAVTIVNKSKQKYLRGSSLGSNPFFQERVCGVWGETPHIINTIKIGASDEAPYNFNS